MDSAAGFGRGVAVPPGAGWLRKMMAFAGPGYLVAVGYMDPGNWATDIAGGSAFGYRLLFVILLSNLMAILLQALCARLGIATGQDLAQACRSHYPRPVALSLWFLAEVAICACDLAEVIGSAIALHLLFGLPLIWGVCLTSLDVLLLIYLVSHSVRRLEAVVISLVLLIGGCFAVELIFCKPDPAAVARGFIPTAEILHNPQMLYLALGILGATVMPHNLYLHSSLVKTRAFTRDEPGKREAIRFACLDSSLALMFALFINAAILIVAGSVFHERGRTDVTEIAQAHQLLSPMLGTTVAGTVFALALLASGQNSTLTGTLAGQIVMEGFLNIRLAPWVRRLLTRLLAIVPAVIASALYGDAGLSQLLIFSQVVLSLQLSFAVVPLVHFTSSRTFMGGFQAPLWMRVLAVLTALLIIGLNAKYLFDFVTVGETGIGH